MLDCVRGFFWLKLKSENDIWSQIYSFEKIKNLFNMIFLFEIQDLLVVLLGIAIIVLGYLLLIPLRVLLLKNNDWNKDSYQNASSIEVSVLTILLGILILFGYAKIEDIINQFIDKFQ